MIRPIMVMTTRISTSVKPSSSRRLRRRRPSLGPNIENPIMTRSPLLSSDNLGHRQERCHNRYDQAADHDADRDDRQRTDDSDHPIETALQLGLVEIGYAACQHRQLSCLFAQL